MHPLWARERRGPRLLASSRPSIDGSAATPPSRSRSPSCASSSTTGGRTSPRSSRSTRSSPSSRCCSRSSPCSGFVLDDDPALREDIVDSTLAQMPVLGSQIAGAAEPLTGSGIALAVGIAGALWAGLGVTVALGRRSRSSGTCRASTSATASSRACEGSRSSESWRSSSGPRRRSRRCRSAGVPAGRCSGSWSTPACFSPSSGLDGAAAAPARPASRRGPRGARRRRAVVDRGRYFEHAVDRPATPTGRSLRHRAALAGSCCWPSCC